MILPLLLAAAVHAAPAPAAKPKPAAKGPDTAAAEFKRMDKSGDGFVDEAELNIELKARFDALDKDKNGWLSSEELIADKTKRKAKLPQDLDGSGKLSFDEYYKWQRPKWEKLLSKDKIRFSLEDYRKLRP